MATAPIAEGKDVWHDGLMRAYIISPPFETFGQDDARSSAAINLVTDILVDCLRRDGDTFHYSVVWSNPGKESGEGWDEDVAVAHVVQFDEAGALRDWLRRSLDPNVADGGIVRSIATCRTVTFGYDGQALLLLRHEDEPPQSPDCSLAVVEERPDLLTDTDYFDGWVHSDSEVVTSH